MLLQVEGWAAAWFAVARLLFGELMETAVLKALALLETLALHPRPVRLTDLAIASGLSKSGTHRLLRTLQEAGYVHQPGGGRRYAATLRLWSFGVRVYNRLDIVAAAKPVMRRLAEQSGSTIYLAQLDALEITYLDRVVGAHLTAETEIGDHAPLHCTATGKALLAWQDPRMIDEVANTGLHAFTRQTIIKPADLRADLARIRADGFAVQCSEWHPSEYAVAAPIFTRGGHLVAAIGLSDATVPDLHAAVCKVAPAVVKAAYAIGQDLSGAPLPADDRHGRSLHGR